MRHLYSRPGRLYPQQDWGLGVCGDAAKGGVVVPPVAVDAMAFYSFSRKRKIKSPEVPVILVPAAATNRKYKEPLYYRACLLAAE